jgi:hypothetical protein
MHTLVYTVDLLVCLLLLLYTVRANDDTAATTYTEQYCLCVALLVVGSY